VSKIEDLLEFMQTEAIMNQSVIIVIATYNEADNIRQVLNGLSDYSVIVVDDNSPDGTGDIATGYSNVTVIHRESKMGLASAYLCGFQKALTRQPQYIVQMDAGLTHDPTDVPHLVSLAEGLAESREGLLVTGSRFYYSSPFLSIRTVISLAATWITRNLLDVPIRDATCGFRCWPAALLKSILESNNYQTRAQGHAWQIEMLYHAWQRRKAIAEVAIEYRLTNSSLKPAELIEALRTCWALWREHRKRRR